MIRHASVEDSFAIAAIYNWYIVNTYFTFEEAQLELKEIGRRIANADEESPWLVLLEDRVRSKNSDRVLRLTRLHAALASRARTCKAANLEAPRPRTRDVMMWVRKY